MAWVVARNAAGQAQQVVGNYRPRSTETDTPTTSSTQLQHCERGSSWAHLPPASPLPKAQARFPGRRTCRTGSPARSPAGTSTPSGRASTWSPAARARRCCWFTAGPDLVWVRTPKSNHRDWRPLRPGRHLQHVFDGLL